VDAMQGPGKTGFRSGFPSSYQTVKRFVRKLARIRATEAVGIILTAAGEEAQVDYGWVRGAGPAKRQVPTDAAVRADAGLQPQIGSSAGVAFEFPRWPSFMSKPFVVWGGCPRVVVSG